MTNREYATTQFDLASASLSDGQWVTARHHLDNLLEMARDNRAALVAEQLAVPDGAPVPVRDRIQLLNTYALGVA